MAQDTTITCAEATWTELTNADASTVTFQVQSGIAVRLKVTTGAEPTNFDGSMVYESGQGEINVDLGNLNLGISGDRLWAYSSTGTAKIAVSHA